MSERETITVRYTPWRSTGWRRILRRITFRPVESPTYEFEAMSPGLDGAANSDNPTFTFQPVGPVRKIDA